METKTHQMRKPYYHIFAMRGSNLPELASLLPHFCNAWFQFTGVNLPATTFLQRVVHLFTTTRLQRVVPFTGISPAN